MQILRVRSLRNKQGYYEKCRGENGNDRPHNLWMKCRGENGKRDREGKNTMRSSKKQVDNQRRYPIQCLYHICT